MDGKEVGTSTASRMEAPSTGNEIEEGKKGRTKQRNGKSEKMDAGRDIRDLHYETYGVVYFED